MGDATAAGDSGGDEENDVAKRQKRQRVECY